jgi:hypothetical protein
MGNLSHTNFDQYLDHVIGSCKQVSVLFLSNSALSVQEARGAANARREKLVKAEIWGDAYTFNAHCASILSQHGSHIGIKPDFAEISSSLDRELLLEETIRYMQENGLDTSKVCGTPISVVGRVLERREVVTPEAHELVISYIGVARDNNAVDSLSMSYLVNTLYSKCRGVLKATSTLLYLYVDTVGLTASQREVLHQYEQAGVNITYNGSIQYV